VKILIAGFTTRAAAESAVRAGCDVITVDHFGDLDQQRFCPNVCLRERRLPYSAEAILEASRDLRYDAVAYCGGLENAPHVVAALARDRALLGNAPEALRRVRDPDTLFSLLVSRGFVVPESRRAGAPPPSAGRWLRKPVAGGGGRGVRVWDGQPLDAGEMLQEYLEGAPGSVSFVADGRQSRVLGWTAALPGPRGFLYGGNVLPFDGPAAAFEEAAAIAAALTEAFELRGLNGFDFVLRAGRPVLVEVNPRYCASMELIERAGDVAMFGVHLAGCRGALPRSPALSPGYWAKAIVYAPTRVAVGDTSGWLDEGVRDVPHPDEVILAGHPVCTVFARGETRTACDAATRHAVEAIHARCAPAASPPPTSP
jgi:predicted ATP-grasp superfamily ATP-dependent carboligase